MKRRNCSAVRLEMHSSIVSQLLFHARRHDHVPELFVERDSAPTPLFSWAMTFSWSHAGVGQVAALRSLRVVM